MQNPHKVFKYREYFPGVAEDVDDDGFVGVARSPRRGTGGMGAVKGDWLFTPHRYHKAFNCFLSNDNSQICQL